MANDINLRIRLNADGSFSVINTGAASLENLGRNAQTANRNLEQLESGTHKAGNALRSMAAIAATALGGLSFAKITQEIGSFESKMINVKALTMANAQEMAAMTQQARELGATTAFSAQQAAEAQGVLASAGLKTNEIMQATPGILTLAAAGALELSKAADIATGVLSGLGLSLEQLPHVNDVLVKVAADTKTSVADMGEALAVSAPIAKTFGISLEDLSAAMGVLANNNIKGSEAGNNFKSMLAALGNETKTGTEILKAHGLAYSDLDIQARGLVPVLETLRNANLSGQEAIKLLGTDAAAAGLALAASASDVDQLTKALKESEGAADAMAAILNQGLEKELDALYGAVSEAILQLGDAGLTGALSDVITTTTGVISVYEGLLPKFAESNKLSVEQTNNLKALAKTIAETTQAALGLAGGVVAVITALRGYQIAMAAVAAISAVNPFTGLMVALGALIGMIYTAKSGLLSLNNAQARLESVDAQIAHQKKKISIMQNEGFLGRAVDTVLGNSVGAANDEITKLQVQRNALVKSLHAEKAATDAAAVSTANKATQDAIAAGKSSALAAATHASGKAHHAAAGGVGKHASAHHGLSEAQKASAKSMDDAKRLTESLMTPQEQFNSEMAQAVNLYNKGKISLETLTRALKKYHDELKKGIDNTPNSRNQQASWDQSVSDANDLDKLRDDADEAQAQANYAKQLKIAGMTNDAIKEQIDLQKQLNAAVKANPNLDPQQVKDLTAQKIAAEQELQNILEDNANFMETVNKKAIENIQDAFSQMFENVLNGSALESFEKFAENVKDSLYKAVSQGFSTALASLFDKNAQTDWTGLIMGGLTIGIKAVGAWLSKKPTAQAVSTSANSSALGSGSMHIADINATSVGHAIYLEELDNYNRRLNNATDMLTTALFTFTDAGTYLTSAVTSVVSSLTGVATTAATTATSAVSSISTYAGYVLSAIKLGYDIVKIADNKYMTDVGKASNAAFAAESAVVAIPVVGWIAAAALRVVGSVLQIVDGEVTKGVSNLLGGHLGALLADLFSPPRTPNAWLNTFNPLNSAENPNKSAAPFSMDGITTLYIEGQKVQIGDDGFYRAYGNKSSVLGTLTPFGATQFSIHEIPKAGANRDEIINGFKPILTALKQVDVSLSKGINAYDAKNGQAGQTMAFFNAWLNDGQNTFKNKQELANVNSAEMISSRYGGIFDVLGASGTKTGKVLDTWYDALVSKFQKTDANYQSLILSIVNGLGNGVETLGKIPLSLAQLVADSVKSTAQGNSVDAVLDDAGKVISVYEVVKAGLDKLGGVSNPDNIVAFLAGLNKVTVSLEEAGGNLLLYAQSLTHASDVTGSIADFAINSAQKKLNDMVQQGASKDEINGYFLSFGQFSKVFKDFGVSFSTIDLDNAANAITQKAKLEADAAKNTIDHAIATEGLTKVSRESALQTLLLSKKIDQATVDAAEYGKAVANASKTVFEGINFVSSLLAGTGANFAVLGLKTGDLVNVSDLLINRFGDMKTAIAETADFIKTAFGDQAFAQYSQNQAFVEQQQILERNPDFKVYGLYAGMNSQNVQDANKAAAKVTGISDNQLIAELSAYNVANPDLGRFVSLSKNFDQKAEPTGYKYNTDFNKTYNAPTPAAPTESLTPAANDYAKADDNAKALAEFIKPFKDAQALRGLSDYAKSLQQLKSSYADNISKANELKASTQDLALITANYNDDVKAAAQNALTPLLDELNNFGKSDLEKSLGDIAKWQKELLADAPDIAKAMKIPLDVFKQGVQQIADQRTLTALKDIFNQFQNFKTSISDWVTAKELQIGTPIDQVNTAQAKALEIYTLAQAGNQEAMGKITGAADTYLSAIDAAYGSSDVGTQLKKGVIEAVEKLPNQISLSDLIQKGNAKNAEELRLLREEVRKLREDNQKQTEALIETNYDANGKAAKSIVGGVTDASERQLHAANAKPELA